MRPEILIIFEYLLFFSSLIVIFKSMNAFDLSRIFKKGQTFQIQILYIVFSVILAYLFSSAIIRLLTLIQGF